VQNDAGTLKLGHLAPQKWKASTWMGVALRKVERPRNFRQIPIFV